jgi:hypothetical protein
VEARSVAKWGDSLTILVLIDPEEPRGDITSGARTERSRRSAVEMPWFSEIRGCLK